MTGSTLVERQVRSKMPALGQAATANVWDVRAGNRIDRERSGQAKVTVDDDGAPRWLAYVLRRLNELGEDRVTSTADEPQAPTTAALMRALKDVTTLLPPTCPTPSVVPTADRGVQFVWHKNGWDVEVDVEDTISLWASHAATSRVISGSLAERRTEFSKILRDLIAS